MAENFTVEIITPEKSIIKTETSEVILPSYEGEIGILKDHIPLITFLRPGLISIKNNKPKNFYIEEGTVEFLNNNLLILTSKVNDLSILEGSLIDEFIKNAEKQIKEIEISDKEKYLLSYKIETLKSIRK